MDLSESVTRHPNIIKSAAADYCAFYHETYQQSILIPWDDAIEPVDINEVSSLNTRLLKKLAKLNPEVILLATGERIIFPDTEILTPLIKNNIGFEVLDNQAAARTFNILMSENRKVVCLMLIAT
ncbi:MAG: MTH938/NDUFAF3 family protein [Proteobacteria bacterium]|nr:MTH938/NDUFAF3 family protein [Pseudomonadota bacterium]